MLESENEPALGAFVVDEVQVDEAAFVVEMAAGQGLESVSFVL